MSISEKLQVIAENEQRVYQAGYDKGVAEGGANFETDGHFEVNIPAPSKTIKSYSDTWNVGIPVLCFEGFTELETVYVPKAERIGDAAFDGCTKLSNVDIGCNYEYDGFGEEYRFVDKLYSVGTGAFSGCTSLKKCKLHFHEDTTTVCGDSAFFGCTSLETIDFLNFYGALGGSLFSGCNNLKAILFRTGIMVPSEMEDSWGQPFAYSPVETGTCYIYVASKFLSDYQFKWPDIANQFRALEDYTVDGTVDGELDETKI
jgi:hypothetical protein